MENKLTATWIYDQPGRGFLRFLDFASCFVVSPVCDCHSFFPSITDPLLLAHLLHHVVGLLLWRQRPDDLSPSQPKTGLLLSSPICRHLSTSNSRRCYTPNTTGTTNSHTSWLSDILHLYPLFFKGIPLLVILLPKANSHSLGYDTGRSLDILLSSSGLLLMF